MSPHAHFVNREYLGVDGMWAIMERHPQYQGTIAIYTSPSTVSVIVRRSYIDYEIDLRIEDVPVKRRSGPVWLRWPQKMLMQYARRQAAKKAFPELFGAPSAKGKL